MTTLNLKKNNNDNDIIIMATCFCSPEIDFIQLGLKLICNFFNVHCPLNISMFLVSFLRLKKNVVYNLL